MNKTPRSAICRLDLAEVNRMAGRAASILDKNLAEIHQGQ